VSSISATIAPTESAQPVYIPAKPKRLLVVRLSAMGDVIHTLPAVTALRAAFPEAHIGWLIEERWAELLCAPKFLRRGPRSAQRPLVDEVHAVDLKAWRKSLFSISTLQRAATVWNDVRDAGYDIAIDLQGAIRSAVLARLSRAKVVYGAAQPWEPPASLWYSRPIVTQGRHVIEQNISVAEAVIAHYRHDLGPNQFCEAIPRDCDAEARIEKTLAENRISDFAIINPGAGWGGKRWPAERYGRVAKGLAAVGISTFVNYGPGEEQLFLRVKESSAGAAKPAGGSISELIALTRHAKLFIGGDTGPLHLAAALQVPVVGIYGPTDPARNGPYGTRSIVLRSPESFTTHARHAEPEEGLLAISADAVLSAARELLRS
jgi:heptosyltransferase I